MKSSNPRPNPNKIRNPYTHMELAHFRALLLYKREQAQHELEAIEDNLANLTDLDDADYSSVAHHMGDVGSDVEEEELNYTLAERISRYLEQIDHALERIDNHTYGICMATGKPIARGRLESVPHTRYSLQAKKQGLAEDI